jgi:hypothetical protein
VGPLRRSADHVEATAFVWRELVRLLQDEGISTWSALQEWLAAKCDTRTRLRRRVWPMPRDVRLSLPEAPGIYRMLRTSGDVVYIGKAASLDRRQLLLPVGDKYSCRSNVPRLRRTCGRLM